MFRRLPVSWCVPCRSLCSSRSQVTPAWPPASSPPSQSPAPSTSPSSPSPHLPPRTWTLSPPPPPPTLPPTTRCRPRTCCHRPCPPPPSPRLASPRPPSPLLHTPTSPTTFAHSQLTKNLYYNHLEQKTMKRRCQSCRGRRQWCSRQDKNNPPSLLPPHTTILSI